MSATAEDPALFPMTADERVAIARGRLERALEKANDRAAKAEAKAEAAALELGEFDAAIDAVREATGGA